jgi:hypothetical protein
MPMLAADDGIVVQDALDSIVSLRRRSYMRTTIEQVVRFFTEHDDLAERASDIAAHLRGDERIARFP